MTVATAVAIAGVAGPASGGADAPASKAPRKATVKAVNFVFVKDRVKIRKGGKVTWRFVEGRHNVKGKGWGSSIKRRGTYTRKFKKAGTYRYRCTLHPPGMKGVVKVVKR